MWQRWGNKQPAISYPTQFTQLDHDDQYDERYLETIPEVDSISSRRQSAHMGLPELPFRSVPPMRDIPEPADDCSDYSQPSPRPASPKNHGLRLNVQMQDPVHAHEISPITPRASQDRIARQDEQPVSPIEPVIPDYARPPRQERAFPSQIPRKVSRPEENSGKAETKWDEYSGEPTHDEKGKPASVRPGAAPVEMQYPHLKERTKQILAGIREREASKKRPWGKAPPPVAQDPLDNPPQREPWRGASGRAPIVEPVKNNPAARQGPIHHPQRNVSREQAYYVPHDNQLQATSSPTAHDLTTLRSPPSADDIKPIVPLKTRNLTPPLVGGTPTQSPAARSPVESPEPILLPQTYVPETFQARVESPQYDDEPTTPIAPTFEEPRIHNYADPQQSFVQPDVEREQSHFSWTTYTTSAADSSPRSMAQVLSSSPPTISDLQPPPITIKKRPVSGNTFMHSGPYMHQQWVDSRGSVVRKPVPSPQPRTSSITSATSRAMSTSKSLPPTPTITEAVDKIENLDAQLDALNRRKHNTTRILAGLEASLKKNAVVYDMWQRKEVEKNIANHKMELDDVGRDIHEISLQLHRAQRKRDRDDNYEACTGLWIKRVTS